MSFSCSDSKTGPHYVSTRVLRQLQVVDACHHRWKKVVWVFCRLDSLADNCQRRIQATQTCSNTPTNNCSYPAYDKLKLVTLAWPPSNMSARCTPISPVRHTSDRVNDMTCWFFGPRFSPSCHFQHTCIPPHCFITLRTIQDGL